LPTLSESPTAHCTYAKDAGLSPKTVQWISQDVTYFADFLGSERLTYGEPERSRHDR